MHSDTLYYLKNVKDGSYWDGSYSYQLSQQYGNAKTPRSKRNKAFKPGFRDTPRLFKTAAALWTSLNPRSFRIKSWRTAYRKAHPWPKPVDGRWNHPQWEWHSKEHQAWVQWVESNGFTSLDLLKRLKPQGFVLYCVTASDLSMKGKPA